MEVLSAETYQAGQTKLKWLYNMFNPAFTERQAKMYKQVFIISNISKLPLR